MIGVLLRALRACSGLWKSTEQRAVDPGAPGSTPRKRLAGARACASGRADADACARARMCVRSLTLELQEQAERSIEWQGIWTAPHPAPGAPGLNVSSCRCLLA
jgi:hypothetical protein